MGRITAILFCLVFFTCWGRLVLEAPLVPLSLDEETGITEAIDGTVTELLSGKLRTQINVSPFHYLVDKAWIALSGSHFHRHFELNFFFRLRSLTIFAFTIALLFLLFRFLALEAGAPAPLAHLFGLSAAAFFQTNNQLVYGVAFQDRPYAIWLLLCALQMLALATLLARPTAAPSRALAWIGALLAFNSFAATTQVLVACGVRWLALAPSERRAARGLFRECVPALGIGTLYFFLRNDQHDTMSAGQFFSLWGEVMERSLWSRADSVMDWSSINKPLAELFPWQLACAATLAVAPLLLPLKKSIRLFALFCALTVLSGFPTTALSWLIGGYLRARYFLYLVPAIGALHLLGALSVGALLWEKRARLGRIVLALWCAAQLAYRIPVFANDASHELRRIPTLELYRSEPTLLCPELLTNFRYGITHRIDSARLRRACFNNEVARPSPSPSPEDRHAP